MKPLRAYRGDAYTLDDDFSQTKVIGQARYFKAGDLVVAIGELNRPNCWNDEAFDEACKFLQAAWNERVKAHGEVA